MGLKEVSVVLINLPSCNAQDSSNVFSGLLKLFRVFVEREKEQDESLKLFEVARRLE